MSYKDLTKNALKSVLYFLHLDITKNMKYDRLTKAIIDRAVGKDSICIDVGAHKGEILDLMKTNAPEMKHYAFEPLPDYYEKLLENYGKSCHVFPYALSNRNGISTFQYVKNAPAYSGIKRRTYAVKEPDIKEITVELKRLDDLISRKVKIDLIKIDVEGAEFLVLKGAVKIITRDKPIVIFECGIGASDCYGTKPDVIFEFIKNDLNLEISTLYNYNKGGSYLTKKEFCLHFVNGSEYYFVAHPEREVS